MYQKDQFTNTLKYQSLNWKKNHLPGTTVIRETFKKLKN